MSDTVIKVENLSKQYRIGAKEGYRTFRETLVDAAKAPFQSISKLLTHTSHIAHRTSQDTIWALKDVSFEVKRGEVVGIIGRNGGGKSTLLKILSKITEPTEGRVEMHGRVGSLLEVGTGFHPELTGHENIYLYGAILGMDRWEVSRKFDEIVAFAELEKFIDTPVKRYSSGMYMRLAFAVAAHLEPEILLVDEVLAVGDAAFQKKCLGKMEDVAQEGRTVLFVSHNMGAVTNLCRLSMLLDRGQLILTGFSSEVVSRYLNSTMESDNGEVILEPTASDAHFTRIAIQRAKGQPIQSIPVTSDFTIRFEYNVVRSLIDLEVSFSLLDRHGSKVFYSGMSKSKTGLNQNHEPGLYVAEVNIPARFLAPGLYSITAGLHQANICLFDRRDNIIGFCVIENGSDDYRYSGQDIGSVLVTFDWSQRKCDE